MSSNVPSGTTAGSAGAKNKPLSPYRKRGSLQYTASTGEWREFGAEESSREVCEESHMI